MIEYLVLDLILNIMVTNEYLNKDQMIKIDLFILDTLKEFFLHQNLWYIDVRNFVDKEILERFECVMEDIEMRIMYNYWMCYLELLEINENEIDKINEKCKEKNINPEIFFYEKDDKMEFKKELFRSYFLEAKINADGLKQIEELKILAEQSEWLKFIFNKFRDVLENLDKIKVIFWALITFICFILIFTFNINISGYIKNIPLINSIVNTDILESFEKVNMNDEFYKQIETLGSKTSNVKVKNISPKEKLFKIVLKNWDTKLIKVTKDNLWKFKIESPNNLLDYRNRK